MIICAILRRFDYFVVCRLHRHEGVLYWVRESAFLDAHPSFSSSFQSMKLAKIKYPDAIVLDREIPLMDNEALLINGDWVSIYTEFLEGDLSSAKIS